jgi:hypothetical protein
MIWGDAGSNWNSCSCGCSRLTFCKREEELDWIEQIRLIGEVALAALLGGLIGFEREIADRTGWASYPYVSGQRSRLICGSH